MDTDPPIFQNFKSKDGESLASLPTYVSSEDGVRYILWSDILLAFKRVELGLLMDAGGHIPMFAVVGETVRVPLCIEYSSSPYEAIFNNEQGYPEEGLFSIQLMRSGPPDAIADQDAIAEQHVKDYQRPIHDVLLSESVLQLGYFLRSFKVLNDKLQYIISVATDRYHQEVVNTRYYYSQTLEELEKLESQRIRVQVDGMSKEELCTLLRDLRQKSLIEEDWNSSGFLLNDFGTVLQHPIPRLFLVLPADLHSWDDSDPTSHKFRVHFLCDNNQQRQWDDWDDEKYNRIPEDNLHVHLSNHPGYNLKRPQEFFQSYGEYVLRVLKIVEHGYRDRQYFVPPLTTLAILQDHDTVTRESLLSKDSIKSLVAKAIAYLQELYPSKTVIAPKLNRIQISTLKTYLDVQDGDNAEGNLHRIIQTSIRPGSTLNDAIDSFPGVSWRCPRHSYPCPELWNLWNFVQSHGGQIDMQYAKLKVDLSSSDDADNFFSLFKDAEYTFDLSIKLNWTATLEQLCQAIAGTHTVILELDGITLDILPQGHVHHMDSLLNNILLDDDVSKAIILRNYPRLMEHSYFYGNFSLLMSSSPVHSAIDWVELSDIAKKFECSVSKGQVASEYSNAVREIKVALEETEFMAATAITVVNYKDKRMSWIGTFDLKEYTMVEVCSINMAGQEAMLSSRSLRTVTVYLRDPEQDKELFDVVHANTLLQNLNVSCYGHTFLSYFENIVWKWLHSPTTSELTLIDRMHDSLESYYNFQSDFTVPDCMADTRGRVLARLARRSSSCLPKSNVILKANTHPPSRQQQTSVPAGIEFLQWDCDEVIYQLDDCFISVLDMATDQHPFVLILFTLDISQLTCHGFTAVQKILRRSRLEHLTIVCSHIDASISDFVTQVLDSVQWSTLKSLKLLGNHIDAWLSLWMNSHSNPFSRVTGDGPRLLSLYLQGTGSAPHMLSHTSALFVHGLVYSCPSVEVLLKNVMIDELFLD